MSLIEIENLTVQYDNIALDNINLKVNEGDFLGIIGPNGAGKSTLFGAMLGLHTQYTGTIKFFGTDIRKSKKYLKTIGYVPQKPTFERNFPVTVRDVVRMAGSNADDIDQILQYLWIHELSNRRIGELSGGQQQRVFIAKALVHKPKILILDEPVTGIDQSSIDLFYSILEDLNKNQNITILLSSHDLDAVSQLSNYVACLNKRLTFHGKSDIFFSNNDLAMQNSEPPIQSPIHIP